MIIHSLSLKDCSMEVVEKIKILDQQYFPFPWTDQQWAEAVNKNSFHLFFNQNLSSFILFSLSPAEALAHLVKILVDPLEQQKGLGSQILGTSHQNLKLLGFERTFLEVESSNQAALKLYDRMGYKKIHFKKKFYSNGADAHIMEKHL
ncbi:hypothetical protein A9Q84_17245 [Halobacteriovorax marinus]|uniref:N-acetyltransferase domain-containing protein n=1 Tax=Halobacteriovorax marinus TaxID=97084 RepID=A0A1Y5F3Q0_9BACT|nr:hypothetical protein A9Q84_17245 [Halobacteriovorax marinus]